MKVNIKLLKNLYMINHPSQVETPMINFIINYCYKIPKIKFELDHYSNLFITKNTTNPKTYPCIVAHMDSFHDIIAPRTLIIKNDIIYSTLYDSTPCGLNADDCNGILIALQLLETLPNLKVCFTVEEEIGGVGAIETKYNERFFSDVGYLIQPDRKGSQDLIYYTNCTYIAAPEFIVDIYPIMNKYNYKKAKGLFTDVGIIAAEQGISGANISCGYYNEHTSGEYCNIKELENCLNFIYEIITTIPENEYRIDISKQAPCFECSINDCHFCPDYDF